ncbi:hypothetical protein DFQ27_003921 [Actinomortierella ambigua]|uniref:Uncharacterized protein n=1 Tax=Actinomortierella ambigua TaxID=1343610 RepID=A0A9P6U4X0_9FUNG|nr:hypothetical protein DFQ27_003921 [Actinomortierella ambigua]
MKVFSIATALLGLTALVAAQDVDKRLIDISDTELDVKEIKTAPGIDTFVVTVQRTDDLLADDGTFLAERVMSVAFDFDVKDYTVSLNKVPLPLRKDMPTDLSTLEDDEPIKVTMTVEANLLVSPKVNPEVEMSELMEAFDTGLVTVQVAAATEYFQAEDGTIARRVTLTESVVEINGQEVVQTDAYQQVIEILADGSLGSYQPLNLNDKPSNGCMADFDAIMAEANAWVESLGWPGAAGLGLICLTFMVSAGFVLRNVMEKRRRYAMLQQEEVHDEYVQVAVDNKKFLEKEETKSVERAV